VYEPTAVQNDTDTHDTEFKELDSPPQFVDAVPGLDTIDTALPTAPTGAGTTTRPNSSAKAATVPTNILRTMNQPLMRIRSGFSRPRSIFEDCNCLAIESASVVRFARNLRHTIEVPTEKLKDDLCLKSDTHSDHPHEARNYRLVMPGGSEQRKKTAATQSALLDVATERLITHALDALAGLVTPSILARSSQTVSVDTAYRLLESPEHAIQMLTNRVIPTEFSSVPLNWPAFSAVNINGIDRFGGESSLLGIHNALCMFITNNFALTSAVVGRIIDAATITASERWVGEMRIRDERIAIARQIRAQRLASVRTIDEELSWMVQIALIQTRRRTKAPLTFGQLIIMLHSFADGCVDRMLLDPDSVEPAEVASAMIDLGFALTEEGLMPEAASRFDLGDDLDLDAIVLSAEQLWRCGAAEDVRTRVARKLSIPVKRLSEAFPTDESLADALAQCVVIGVPINGSRESRLALLSAALHRLAQFADEIPTVIELLWKSEPTSVALAELREAARSLTEEGTSESVDPERIADQLIATASKGLGQWDTTRLLIDVLRG